MRRRCLRHDFWRRSRLQDGRARAGRDGGAEVAVSVGEFPADGDEEVTRADGAAVIADTGTAGRIGVWNRKPLATSNLL